ncbi:MAG: TcpD family membrane protein [Oscillospiraceae bacterium]|nr:TcpD family membrane protein [Oscillospiraceae bacterium]
MEISKRGNTIRFIGMILIAAILLTNVVFAATNYGENAGTWLIQNIVWIAGIAVAIIAIKLFFSGNIIKMLIVLAVGGIVIFIVMDPMRLQTIGETIWNEMTKAS